MSQERQEPKAPRIVSPGGGGWAQEPNVTHAEIMLYGATAPVVRLLGQAATAAGDAYSIACKHRAEWDRVPEDELAGTHKEQVTVLDTAVQEAWTAFQRARHAYAVIAGDALVSQREQAKDAGLLVPLPSAA